VTVIAASPDRGHVTAYARWKLGADYARKLRTGRARQSTHKAYYEKLRVAISLIRWLHENDLTLEQTTQAELDEWLTGPPSRALPNRAFLNWANTAGIVPALHVPRPAPRTSNTPIDHATRLRQARSLLHDDDIEPSIRITGTLLLLYGQLITRLVRLRTTDLQIDQHNNVQLRLGEDPIAVPEPLATLLRHQREQASDSWLFPGAKPGTHIGPERIRRRLRQLGISPRTTRPGALLALAVTVPAPILAELLATTTTPPTTGDAKPPATGPATPTSPARPPPDSTAPAPRRQRPGAPKHTGRPPPRRPRSDHRHYASRYARGSATTVARPPSSPPPRQVDQAERHDGIDRSAGAARSDSLQTVSGLLRLGVATVSSTATRPRQTAGKERRRQSRRIGALLVGKCPASLSTDDAFTTNTR
jgi:hypothetical protein